MTIGFKDPLNPTEHEIRAWASVPEAVEPLQDWDLILESDARDELYLELASAGIANRRYFLHILYLIVGDASRPILEDDVRTKLAARASRIVSAAAASNDPELTTLATRAAHLAAHPESFDYAAWCGGGLAYERAT
jgi:hypothetical protein